jgi:alpha-galactosidase
MSVIQFENLQVTANFDKLSTTPGGYILKGCNVSLLTPFKPCSFYQHGWQSWSLAAWTNLGQMPAPKPDVMIPRIVDPVYAKHPSANGSWVGAVEFEDGNILLLGALGLESHVQYRDGNLAGWYESDGQVAEWFAGYGPEASIFNIYAGLLGERFGRGSVKTAYRVWCSWYGLYTSIDEKSLLDIFDAMGDLPFDVLQIDDGWQIAVGDWQPNAKFPSGMEAMAAKIMATGRKAGLWLAPLLVSQSSNTYRQHPDWVLRDESGEPTMATFNWGEWVYALDITHPEVLEWLSALMKRVTAWGFEYIKLDFLSVGAYPGKRTYNIPREAAYRQALAVMRQALGKGTYLLTSGAPILPSLGLCDAMRIGPDVAALWESYRDAILLYNPSTPAAKNAIRTTIHRLWLAPLVHTDPDVVFFRSIKNTLTPAQIALLQDLARVCGFKATSDLPQWLTSSERTDLREFLTYQPTVTRTGRYSFDLDGRPVDFSLAMSLPEPPRGLISLISSLANWLGNQAFVLGLLEKLQNNEWEKLKKETLNHKLS